MRAGAPACGCGSSTACKASICFRYELRLKLAERKNRFEKFVAAKRRLPGTGASPNRVNASPVPVRSYSVNMMYFMNIAVGFMIKLLEFIMNLPNMILRGACRGTVW